MSDTKIHKAKGRWNAGIQELIPDCLRLYWDRHNSERSYFHQYKKLKTKKIEQKNKSLGID
jgi:hypothetical protein